MYLLNSGKGNAFEGSTLFLFLTDNIKFKLFSVSLFSRLLLIYPARAASLTTDSNKRLVILLECFQRKRSQNLAIGAPEKLCFLVDLAYPS